MRKKSVIKIKITVLFLLSSSFLYSQRSGTVKPSDWVIAVSEFTEDGLPSAYKHYKTLIPKMFLSEFNAGAGAKRLVPFEEKKMRAIMDSSLKKIALIKERAKLIAEKDELFLSVEDIKIKEKKRKKLEKDILQKEKSIAAAAFDIKIEETTFLSSESPENVRIWNKDSSLYKVQDGVVSGEVLKREQISAVVYGTVKDISGYMVLQVKLDTGVRGLKVHEFSSAGRYEDAEKMVKTLALQIYSAVQNTKEVQVYFDISPKNAKLYIDNRAISDFSKPLTLYEGVYTVNASAENYMEASKTIELKNKKAYALKIDLKKVDLLSIGFNLESKNPHVFFKSQYAATVPGIITVPGGVSILEFQQGGNNTFALVDGSTLKSPGFVQQMIVTLNQKNVKKSIEFQRKILYWSLAALYVTVPITMILGAHYNEQAALFRLGRLPQNQDTVNKINRLGITHSVFQGITIAFGVNYLVQLIIYLVRADKALPAKVKINPKKEAASREDILKNVKPIIAEIGVLQKRGQGSKASFRGFTAAEENSNEK